jgi:hypothetical protein
MVEASGGVDTGICSRIISYHRFLLHTISLDDAPVGKEGANISKFFLK